MKANELRVTNLIENDRIVNAILFIGYDSVELITPQGNHIRSRLDMIRPIQITKEWLIRLGFIETYSSQFRLKFDHPCNFIGFDFSKTEDKSMEGFRYYGQYINIKYVHQLQNLYFALTGEELTLT